MLGRLEQDEAVLAAKEAVRMVGFGLGNLMCRIYRGEVNKPDWDDADRNKVRGTSVFLLGGSICTLGYTGQLLPLIAKRQIDQVDPEFGMKVQIFTPYMDSAHAGAFGAYFMAVGEDVRSSVRERAQDIYSRNKIPVLPLLDIGGTKVALVLAYVGQRGLTLDVFQSHTFASPVGKAKSFYRRLASLIASPLAEVSRNPLFELVPVLAVGQPGRLDDPKGKIGPATAKDLGPDFPGQVPSELLQESLRPYIGDIDVYCANDGRSQFMGIGVLSHAKTPERWKPLRGHDVAYLGLGTGLGAGFGHIDLSDGYIRPFKMHNAFDIEATDAYEEMPRSAYLGRPLLTQPYSYGDLLSGKFFRRFVSQVDLDRFENGRELLFVPRSSAKHLSKGPRALLESDDRLSPLNSVLINDILHDEVVTARTEEIVDTHRRDLEHQLRETLSVVANELDGTLLKNVRTSNYAQAIEEVALAKRRGRRVQFLGIGKSHSICRDLAYIYSNLGIDSICCELTGANSENLTNLHQDDLVFLISHSGRAAELLELIPYIHRKRCRTVALTGFETSPLAQLCSYFVNTYVTKNPHPVAEAPTTSTTSALAAGTAIGMVVSCLFDYDAEDFFLDHPNLQFNVAFPNPGVRADASFDWLAKVEDIFRRFATSVRELLTEAKHDFVSRMISLTKRILVSHFNGRTIFFTGTGSSLRVAEKIAATLTSIGIDASAVNSAQLPHGDFAHIRHGDLLVIISFSGETKHLLRIREIARLKNVDCAAITSQPGSTLARGTPNELCVVAGEGADDADLVPIPEQKILSSFINLTVGDALAVILNPILGRTSKEFAEEAHQGGEIARRHSRLPRELLGQLGLNLAESIAANPAELERVNRGLAIPVSGVHLESYERRGHLVAREVPEVMIFGMGGIGLAFLAPLFNERGKTIWFVESDASKIRAMKEVEFRYRVLPAGGQATRRTPREIGRVSVIPSNDSASITATALRVDLIVTAVGVTRISEILQTLADIVKLRYEFWLEEPLNILFSENFAVEPDPLARVRHQLREMLDTPELKVYFDGHVGLVPAIDEAIVPEVKPSSLGDVIVVEEESAPLFVDRNSWRGRFQSEGRPKVPNLGKGVIFTDSFAPLHMRKLWVHNMAHALIGYLGHFAGHTLVYDAVVDPKIEAICKRAMRPIGAELYRRWSYRDTQHRRLDEYLDWRWARYQNGALGDEVSRLCREPRRKLQKGDRLVGPANYVRKYALAGPTTDSALVDILVGVVAAIYYAAEGNEEELSTLRGQVLGDLVNIDSGLLNRAEEIFRDWFPRTFTKGSSG